MQYQQETNNYTFWTGSMFSGMPNYQIGGGEPGTVDKILYPIRWLMQRGIFGSVFFIFFYYLIAFFLLLRAFKIDKWLSLAGAFAMALSSYFFIIIAASHHGKCYSITWMMMVIIGFILTYRKQYGWGAILIMFFTYAGFFLHPQMSYYICMLIGTLWFAELAIAWRDKAWKHFGIATAVFFASFAVGMGMGSGNIFMNSEYAAETMRGGHSDIVKETDATNRTKGLDLDYATAWSYGIDETMTFLIPNYMGEPADITLAKTLNWSKTSRRWAYLHDKPDSSASLHLPIAERKPSQADRCMWVLSYVFFSYSDCSSSEDPINGLSWRLQSSPSYLRGDTTVCG